MAKSQFERETGQHVRYFIGLMSGTSADAIDAVLIECAGMRFRRVIAVHAYPYPAELRRRVLDLGCSAGAISLEALVDLEAAITEQFASAALALLENEAAGLAIAAVGSHGQTVFHRGGASPATLQLGDGGRLAERCGLSVVTDFRRRDIALGGQGAPLVPAFHHALFAAADEFRAVLNLGGIANLTLLPNTDAAQVRGFDTGPANALLDEWCLLHRGQPHDEGGLWATSGTVIQELLSALLAEPFFAAPPPKSTGRGDFHLPWVRARYPTLDAHKPADVQATLAELTAVSIVDALARTQPETKRLLICGGGGKNIDLLARIERQLALKLTGDKVKVQSTSDFGLDPQAVEGAAFAWLAMRAIDGDTGNLPGVTGASRATVLGAIYPAPA